MTEPIGPFERSQDRPQGCRRATGRIEQEQLVSNLGPVQDISRGGLRLLSDRNLRGEHELKLPTNDGELAVSVRVVWSRRRGLRRFMVGLEFVDLNKATARRLAQIATMHTRVYPLAG